MKAEQLRKAILQMAIQGKLVPQDPNDEPASILLEKIRAEKQRLIKEGKIKKDKVDSVIFKGDDNRHYEKIGNNTPVCIEDELPFDIPKSWEWVKLKQLCLITTGKRDANFGNPNGEYDFFTCATEPIKCQTYSYDGEYLILPGNGANVGMSIHYIGKFEAYQRTYLLEKICHLINFYYIQFLLNAIWKDYNKDKQYGSAIPYIKLGNLENFYIPLPPLAEQERIVAEIKKYEPLIAEYEKLEQQKSKLDCEIYDKLKKSILQYAIQGKLIPQDENDEPASELLKRIRTEKKAQLGKKYVDSYIYKGDDNCYYEHMDSIIRDARIDVPFEIPNSWSYARLGNYIELMSGRDLEPSQYNANHSGIPYITGASNFNNGELVLNRWTDTPIVISHIGDLLITCKGTIGEMAYNKIGDLHIARQVMAINSDLNIEYIASYLRSKIVALQAKAKSMIPGISRPDIENALIPIPPRSEQQRIVDKLNEILTKL